MNISNTNSNSILNIQLANTATAKPTDGAEILSKPKFAADENLQKLQVSGVQLGIRISPPPLVFFENISVIHDAIPKEEINSALSEISKELSSIDKIILRERPDLSKSIWDFAVKDKRLIVVDSNLKESDKQWLENFLNSRPNLLASAVKINKAAVDDWETSFENPSTTPRPGLTDSTCKNYYDVAEQLNGKIRIKDLMQQSVKDLGKSGSTMPYIAASNVIEKYLVSSEKITQGYKMKYFDIPADGDVFKNVDPEILKANKWEI